MSLTLVSFDWAMKRLLRSPANFDVLEGFLQALLGEVITIDASLESESLQDHAQQKQTRVDLKARDAKGRTLIIELQHERQDDFLSRILFGASKALVDQLPSGVNYLEISKIIAISLVYFSLGQGTDYGYHGSTHFMGISRPDEELQLNAEQKRLYQHEQVHRIFPEYYILRVNEFNDVAKTSLEEWLYVLKHSEVKESFSAPGLAAAAEKLAIMKLSAAERAAYEAHEIELHDRASTFASSYGRGLREGEQKTRLELAQKLAAQGMATEEIIQVTGVDPDEYKENPS